MKKFVILFSLILFVLSVFSQDSKRPLTFDDILKWNRITEKKISNDGNFVVYKLEPWKGDSEVKIVSKSGNELASISCGNKAEITSDSKFVIFTIKPEEEEVKQLKLKKTKKEDMPLNQLGIYNLETENLESIANLKSVKVPKNWDGWIVYQTKSIQLPDTSKTENDEKEKMKEESDDNGYMLNIKNLNDGTLTQFPFVTSYVLAKDSKSVAFVSTGDDKEFKAGVYVIGLTPMNKVQLINSKGEYKQLAFNEDASRLAFLADTTDNKKKDFDLFLWNKSSEIKEIINNENGNIPEGWEISINGEISFGESTNRIFLGLAPIKPEKDTTVLEEEIPVLDVWHWNEPILHTQQLNKKSDNLKKSYLSVYHLDDGKLIQLEKENLTGIKLINKGDSDKVLAWSNLPYSIQTMWEGYPYYNDFYLVDIKTGEAKMIKEKCLANPNISPGGKYVYWYNFADTSWYTYQIKSNIEYKITNPDIIQCADEINDVPNYPYAYGIAGWLQNDEALLVYDRYDIWKVDPENKKEEINITKNGRINSTKFRLVDFENDYLRSIGEERIGIDPKKTHYLLSNNEINRNDGIYTVSLTKSGNPKQLIYGSFYLTKPFKAKDSDVYVYTRETFQEFPDLLVSENNFKKSKKISNANPQQSDFLWGTKELYSWTSLDGQKLEGLLVKPANFDPNKKYPLIVNFYEKSSQRLYNHQIPEAHRSTVDYHYYSSNDYIIFNPDVYYKEGYPGESAFNCVMPGVTQLINEGFIDENAIAAQGHSWGGYQVAYLATRTNLFAAIESGAPVVNMFSAYGGIRLWSGRNRAFQYERTQSRIGKTIWESPLRYLENSPLFTADKIETPMLIMHNEDDGAVPFSQGIEFFIALRRMGKTAWLLNYNEADHWPTKVRDKYDFQIRLAQFFDHYLKGKPMPLWMKEGIPAVDKGYELGY